MKESTYIDLDSSISSSVSSSSHDTSEYVKVRKVSEDKNRVDPRVLANDFIAHYRRVLQRLGLHSGARKCQYRRCDESFERNSRFSLIQDPEFENIDWD
jgi:hypothetical protein